MIPFKLRYFSTHNVAERREFGYWRNIDHQRKFFDNLARKWNILEPKDWISIRAKDVIKEGGSFLSLYYKSSLLRGN
jgi:hypothetical protein